MPMLVLSNAFLDHLVDCGVIPEGTIACVITLRVGDLPTIEYEVIADEATMKAVIVDAPIEILKDVI